MDESHRKTRYLLAITGYCRHWWHRPSGGREVLALALPLVVSTLSFTVMHFCDRIFLSWYSTAALAAVLSAGVLGWTMFSLPMGIAGYANTFVAQYFGSRQPKMIGRIVWQAIRVGIWSIPLFLLIGIYCRELFEWFGHSQRLIELETLYFQIIAIGAGAIVIDAALSAYFTGRGKTRVVMIINLLAAGLNIALDPLLIFGAGNFPALGIEGAAWATTISLWFKVVAYAAIMGLSAEAKTFGLREGRVIDWVLFYRLLKFGTPNGFQFLMEGGAITIFVLLIAKVGEIPAAATAVAFSINMVAFVPVIGMGIAVSTIVGQRIGERNPNLAARSVWTGLTIALAYNSVFAFCYIVFPTWFLWGYAVAGDQIEQVESLAKTLLMFVAAYCLFDAVQLIFVSALKGAGDTWYVLSVTLITSALFVLSGYWGTSIVTDQQNSLLCWWYALTGWIVLLAIAYILRFHQGKWRSMSVIQYQDHEPSAPLEIPVTQRGLPLQAETIN
jgi:multidrug resistance protein, MATE family